MLFFNKQYRAEKKIILELARKIQKSKNIHQSYHGNTEVYELDTMSISFGGVPRVLTVTNEGQTIFSLDCEYSDDELQQVRFDWFHLLLNDYARKRWNKEKEKQEKQEKFASAKEKIKQVLDVKTEQQKRQEFLQQSLKNIRRL
ncbi:MAG: hypothetical protein IJR92_01910 [Alphaproteobacteria bacterium]|nr:hypothetical protein [Alphaproteobacteria bacterium]